MMFINIVTLFDGYYQLILTIMFSATASVLSNINDHLKIIILLHMKDITTEHYIDTYLPNNPLYIVETIPKHYTYTKTLYIPS